MSKSFSFSDGSGEFLIVTVSSPMPLPPSSLGLKKASPSTCDPKKRPPYIYMDMT